MARGAPVRELDPTLAEYLVFRAIGYVPDLDEWPAWKVLRMLDTDELWRAETARRQAREMKRR